MIYLMYLAEDTGVPIWKYENPRTPSDILNHIIGKEDAIVVGYLSSLASFGKLMLGEQVQQVSLGKYNIYYWYFSHGERKLIVLAVCDSRDSDKAVYRVFKIFLEKSKRLLDELFMEIDGESFDTGRIEFLSKQMVKTFQNIIDGSVRRPSVISKRDKINLVIASVSAYTFFTLMLYLTVYLNSYFGWFMKGEIGTLLLAIGILDLVLPSILLGYMVGSREGAYRGGLITGVAILITLIARWFDRTLSLFAQLNLGLLAFPILGILILILSGAIGFIASLVAGMLVEDRYLVPPF